MKESAIQQNSLVQTPMLRQPLYHRALNDSIAHNRNYLQAAEMQ